MTKYKFRLPFLLISCLVILAAIMLPNYLPGAQAQSGSEAPVKYIKFEPTVFDPSSGGDVKILWNFQLSHQASIKILNGTANW